MTFIFHTDDAKDKTTYARMSYGEKGYIVDKFGSKNCFAVHINQHDRLFFSYATLVAAIIDGEMFITNEKYSNTTTRHVNYYIGQRGWPKTTLKPESFFMELKEKLE